ncbi:MAG: redox-regulated ATPase YchF [Lentisphaerae bacterium GWF2_45_14]|nr:MAG: redox-regulated ATPase YchF [Lentisphaerae bacterium GWF2_45_14]
MGFSCGFVGLPNVGKSTIFNALSRGTAAAANFPFCTIEPNTGIVPVPDKRLLKLVEIEKSAKVVPSSLKFIDIAGLVEGASQGQGLGNQFLGHIRNIDAVAHIVRLFSDSDVVHVSGHLDPVRDLELIITELMLADLDFLERKLHKTRKLARSGDDVAKAETAIAESFSKQLGEGKIPDISGLSESEKKIVAQMGMITIMPSFVCANVDEEIYRNFGKEESSKKLIDFAASKNMEVVPVCGKLEEELAQLDPEDVKEFLADMGMNESGLDRVIHTGYKLLNYITFFTAGPQESRAWTICDGTAAPQAAGQIHSDMERGFIRIEVITYDDMVKYNGWNSAKAAGKLRIEGKEYIMKDADCVFVRFSV